MYVLLCVDPKKYLPTQHVFKLNPYNCNKISKNIDYSFQFQDFLRIKIVDVMQKIPKYLETEQQCIVIFSVIHTL